MHLQCDWNQGLQFSAKAGANTVTMDAKAPIGRGSAPTPKELLVAAVCGCTAMDIITFLRKARQNPTTFTIDADVQTSGKDSRPAVFTGIELVYKATGETTAAALLEAVKVSQTLDCGVSAMLSRAVPIRYRVQLNGTEIGSGAADFSGG